MRFLPVAATRYNCCRFKVAASLKVLRSPRDKSHKMVPNPSRITCASFNCNLCVIMTKNSSNFCDKSRTRRQTRLSTDHLKHYSPSSSLLFYRPGETTNANWRETRIQNGRHHVFDTLKFSSKVTNFCKMAIFATFQSNFINLIALFKVLPIFRILLIR